MATYTAAMTPQDPLPRSTTPRARPSSVRIITKHSSYQPLISPALMNPAANLPFSPVSPDWPAIQLLSPSTASHRSMVSTRDEVDSLKSPRLALLTSGLDSESEGLNQLISPSAPVPQPGDELLYDIVNEEKPDLAFFSPEFQSALTRTKQEMNNISLALWGYPGSHQSGSHLHALKQRAQQLSEFEPMRTRRIAVVGDSGAGKRGVVNALLDKADLAPSTPSHDDSSSVITEYWFRPAHHNEPFAIEVDYLPVEEIRELIQELLRTFRAGYEPSVKEIDDLAERTDTTEKADKAWHTLHVMFRNQQFFTKEFLLRYPANAQTPLIDVLHHWALEFLATRPGGGKARTWSAAAFDVEECSDRVDGFTSSPVDESTSALWPFVRLVRVYLRSPILQSGVVLVDCPTPRNLDYARARTTERCLRSCHEIFVVAPRDQALENRCLSDIVERIGRHRPLSIICTKTDDISTHDVERRDTEVSLQVRTWRQQVSTLRMQLKRSEAQRRHGIPGALQEEARNRDLLSEMSFGLKQFLVERRNAQVANQLIERYAARAQVGDLKIFCVSSHDYWNHRYDEHGQAVSRLDLSGIVDLRRYCHGVAAEVQFEEASAFLEGDVPAFLGSLKMWAVEGVDEVTVEKAEEVRGVLEGLKALVVEKIVLPSSQLHAVKSTLNAEFASTIVFPIRESRSEWRNAALEASKEWTKWNVNDYAAFCRHYGTHATEASGHRNWNEELIRPMRLQLEQSWENFHVCVENSEKELIQYIDEVLDEIGRTLRDHLPTAPESVRILLTSIPHRKATITHLIHIIFASLLEVSLALRSDTLNGHLSSTTNTLMAPAYHAASAVLPSPNPHTKTDALTLTPPHSPSPSLVDQQRKDIVTSHIASARIFSRLSTMVEKAHRGIVREAFADLGEGVGRVVGAFVEDLGVVVGKGGQMEEGREKVVDQEFKAGVAAWVETAEGVVGEVGVAVREVGRVYVVVGEEGEVEEERAGNEDGGEVGVAR